MRALALALCLAAAPALAADPAMSARATIEPARLGPGDVGALRVVIEVPSGWHLWPLDPGPGPKALDVQVSSLEWRGGWVGTEPHPVFDRGFGRELLQYGEGEVHLARHVVLVPGAGDATLRIRGQICSDTTCLDQKIELPLALETLAQPVGHPAPELVGVALTVRAKDPGPRSDADALASAKEAGLLSFILLAFLAGLGALATPCVFPAIPMTVSFFSKYSEKSFGHGARLAAFYSISMMLYFTLAGLLVSVIFGVTGIQRFAAHPIFNLILAGVLVLFALSLMGWFKIETPLWAYNLMNRLEMKWGPNAGRAGGVLGDYVAVGVAAMTATTVFFTCTVAFVGVVLVAAADGEWFYPTLGMLAFSAAFVLPFFLLALFPNAAARLRGKSGEWIKAVSVTLGFVELAAAFKFFSNADLVWRTNLLSRDLVLASWVALFALLGLFLIGKLDLRAADEPPPPDRISVPRVMAGAGTFVFTLYLAMALFSGKPLAGWVNGWLPPQLLPGEVENRPVVAGASFDWVHDLEAGRAKARADGRLVFVNYTGFTCTNCRYMETGVFPRPEIAALLRRMVLVELYTDGLEPEHEKARDDQLRRFKTAALPFYSVERADGTVVATFPSSTNDPDEFRRFLAGALDGAAPAPAAPGLVLATTRLADGVAEPAIVPGKWSLVNFWATWCAPCREELDAFLARVGKDIEARGGRFAAVAVEDDDTVADARAFMEKVGVPKSSALRLPAELSPAIVDPKLGFGGERLPYTVLVSPSGEVVWRHEAALDEAALRAVLTEHLGLAALRQ